MELIQLNKEHIIIVNGNFQYTETTENYIKDGGKYGDVDLLVHDDSQNYCCLNNEIMPFPQQEYIDEIHRCEEFIKAAVLREYNDTPLETFKERKLSELKQARNSQEQQPVTTDKGAFDVDNKSLERVNGAITVLKISGGAIDWTLADNTVVPVTADDLTNVIVALAQQSNTVHEKYRQLKEQVEACTTKEQVEAIEW